MTKSEKLAWWTLGITVLTIVAWGTLFAFSGKASAASSAFPLLALAFKGKRTFDERESAIARKALLTGLQTVWGAFALLVVFAGFQMGWDWQATLTIPLWQLHSGIWWGTMLLLAVESIATLVLYRGDHA